MSPRRRESRHVMAEQTTSLPDVDLVWEGFGSRDHPVVLLIAGQCQSMTWWDAEFCRRLAAQGRYVVRYDHRDTGCSTTWPAGHPAYSERELTTDPVGLLDAIGAVPAHVVGVAAGGPARRHRRRPGSRRRAVGRRRHRAGAGPEPAAPGGHVDADGHQPIDLGGGRGPAAARAR